MCWRQYPRRLSILVFSAILGVFGCLSADGAAPWFLMFHGNPLQKRIVLSDRYDNQRLMVAITEQARITDDELKDRPYIRMAYFWGPEWVPSTNRTAADKLKPEEGNQHGRFYPAYGNAEAIVTFDNIPGSGPGKRRISADGLKILSKYQIVTSMEDLLTR
jgi:hypothetical protein